MESLEILSAVLQIFLKNFNGGEAKKFVRNAEMYPVKGGQGLKTSILGYFIKLGVFFKKSCAAKGSSFSFIVKC